MAERTNLLQIGVGPYRQFTIAWYEEGWWDGKHHYGFRKMGKGRFALDFFHISFLFENYAP
jgi:hypothetical protein